MKLDVVQVKQWMELFSEKIAANVDHLNELDGAIGDGDHGSNMHRGMTAVMNSLATNEPADLAAALKQVAFALISQVGGAAGPLYGSAFLAMSQSAVTTPEVDTLVKTGAAAIANRGAAKVGDKTMLDVWQPAAEHLAATDLTQEQVIQMAEATKPLIAKRGRASYLGERAQGHMDPGAQSSAYLITALLEVMEG